VQFGCAYPKLYQARGQMILNMHSPIIRASFGMFFGTAMVMALRFLPGLDYLNIFHGIGAGGFGGAAMVALRQFASPAWDLAVS
jgi:hypothetical protein